MPPPAALKISPPLLLASANEGKLVEMQCFLAPLRLPLVSGQAMGLGEVAETGRSFAENAALKAESAARQTGLAALGDDSGLEVEALGGRPGIYSARLAGETRDFAAAAEKLRAELAAKNAPASPARFICVLALARPKPNQTGLEETLFFTGKVEGRVCFPPRGNKGFGYDPIFIPEGHTESFGEMAPGLKHALSHRARAMDALLARLAPSRAD